LSNSMKIRIHAQFCRLNLRIPDNMLYNTLTCTVIRKTIQENTEIAWTMDKETTRKMMRLLKHFSKEYRGLTIVDVETADGEIVQITL